MILNVSGSAGTFVVSLADHTAVTVTVSSTTQFSGDAKSFAELQYGMSVTITGGYQPGGTFAATIVDVTFLGFRPDLAS